MSRIGFLQDKNGDLSSGRLIKVFAFVMACFISIFGISIASFALFTSTVTETMAMEPAQFVILITALVGSFLTVALGSEITQKATNQ